MLLMEAVNPINTPAFPKAKNAPLRFKSAHDSPKRRQRDERFDSHHRRHRKRRHRPKAERENHDHEQAQNVSQEELDPDAAFRESLFDAMADDEGADYWASIYGQPIHNFPQDRLGLDGKLERMSEEEYVEFVRAEMWKRTNAGLLEERERREKARTAASEARDIRERIAREEREFQKRVDDSIRRGQEREEQKSRQDVWSTYQRAWQTIERGDDAAQIIFNVPWPAFTGSQDDLSKDSIEKFFQYGVKSNDNSRGLESILKEERRRWHPDKVQQRAKGTLDETTLRKVTATFQLIDDLWTKYKSP